MGDTSAKSRVGSRVGPYQLRRLLGRGGMGEVYEAYDTRKDRVVALKLMSEEFSQNPSFRERMQREAHTAGRLQEPHIVPIHDYGQIDGQIDGQMFIEMRFIEGSDVGRLLNRCGPLAPPRAVAIVRQVAAALDSAHRAGVIHRDIKPENVLLTDDDFACLVDFGIAAAITDEHLTQTGAAVGTWQYMAPERFGTAEVTYRVDIYALACVLFECLVGAPPYQADSLSALVGAHLHQAIPRPSELRPGIPPAFDEVIARGMAKQPADRFARAGDLAQAAQNALTSSDQHQAPSLLRNVQKFTPTVTPVTTLPPARPPWAMEPGPAPRGRKPLLILGSAVLLIVAAIAGLAIWQVSRGHGRGAQPSPPTTSDHAAAPTVPIGRLDGILLTSAEINDILGTSDTQIGGTAKRMDTTAYTLSNPNCLGALFSFMQPVYAGSGYTAVSTEAAQGQGNSTDQLVTQGVVAFPSAEQASAFVQSSAASWQACAGQSVTETQSGPPEINWAIGDLVGRPPKITQLATMKSAAGPAVPCQHALSAVSNVVFDVSVCGHNISDQAGRIADAMGAKVTK